MGAGKLAEKFKLTQATAMEGTGKRPPGKKRWRGIRQQARRKSKKKQSKKEPDKKKRENKTTTSKGFSPTRTRKNKKCQKRESPATLLHVGQ